jgi:transcription antitermination factor NusG
VIGAVGTFWFALRVKPRMESLTAVALDAKGFEQFLPLQTVRRRWSDRVKTSEAPLFAGYVFCRFDPLKRLPILTTPGVSSIVGFGLNPTPVADEEISSLQTVMRSGFFAAPCPFIKAGQKVRIDVGPLRGTEGIVINVKNATRLVVSVNLLQRSVAVEIDRLWVSPSSVGYSQPASVLDDSGCAGLRIA